MLMNSTADILHTASSFTHGLTTKQIVDACAYLASHTGTEEEALEDLASSRHPSAQEEALVIETCIHFNALFSRITRGNALVCSVEIETGRCDGWCR